LNELAEDALTLSGDKRPRTTHFRYRKSLCMQESLADAKVSAQQ